MAAPPSCSTEHPAAANFKTQKMGGGAPACATPSPGPPPRPDRTVQRLGGTELVRQRRPCRGPVPHPSRGSRPRPPQGNQIPSRVWGGPGGLFQTEKGRNRPVTTPSARRPGRSTQDADRGKGRPTQDPGKMLEGPATPLQEKGGVWAPNGWPRVWGEAGGDPHGVGRWAGWWASD